MKPGTAAKIARRIGMYQRAPDVAPHALWWYDPGAVCCDEVDEDDPNGLAVYLATGDRPLRVMEAMMDGAPVLASSPSGTLWTCICTGDDNDNEDILGEGTTPALAIIACAAALEEGNE